MYLSSVQVKPWYLWELDREGGSESGLPRICSIHTMYTPAEAGDNVR